MTIWRRENGGSIAAVGDATIASDTGDSGSGAVIFKTSGTERARFMPAETALTIGSSTPLQTGYTDAPVTAALSVTGALVAATTATEHRFINNWAGQGTVSIWNKGGGYSAVRFLDESGTEHMAVGYGCTGSTSTLPFYHAGYVETSNGIGIDGTDDHTQPITPLRLVTSGLSVGASGGDGFSNYCRLTFEQDLTSRWLFASGSNNTSTFKPQIKIDHAGKSTTFYDNGSSQTALVTINQASGFAGVTMAVVNATASQNVLSLQNTSTTGFTTLQFLDSSGSNAGFVGYGNSGTSFASIFFVGSYASGSTAKEMQLVQWISGSPKKRQQFATDGSVVFYGSDGSTQALKLTAAESVLIGKASIATTATDGFGYMTATAGAPTGTPTAQTGFVPFHYDTTNHKLWVYDGGWKGVVLS